MTYKITYKVDGFAAASKADMRNVQRDTWGYIGKYWHKNYKAIKFTKRGARLYKFAPRAGEPGSGKAFKGSYTGRKLKEKKHTLPNVWSGTSRLMAMSNRKVIARAQSSGRGSVDIIINAPALNFNRPEGKVRPAKDVTSIVPNELNQMSKVSVERFDKQLQRIRRTKTIKS